MSQANVQLSLEALHARIEQQEARLAEQQAELTALRARRSPSWHFRRIGQRFVLIIVAGIAALALTGAAVARMQATIPDATGIIHACYSTANGSLRVTDRTCHRGEKSLSWYQRRSRAFCPQCNMAFIDLSKQKLGGAYLAAANLRSANLAQAILRGANLNGADLRKGSRTVNGQQQAGPPTNLQGTALNLANLQGADLEAAEAPSASFGGANLASAVLYRGNFFNADFTQANLTNTGLDDAYLRSATLHESLIENVDLTGAILSDAKLEFARGTPVSTQSVVWGNTICPDRTNSDTNPGRTCNGHWLP